MDTATDRGPRGSYVNEYFQYVTMKGKLGLVPAAVRHRGLCALLLGDDRASLERELRGEFPGELANSGGYGLEGIGAMLVTLTETLRIGVSLPLDVKGSAFQLAAWSALRDIPVGETRTYSDIARQINAPVDGIAVSEACLANRIAVGIPCHRAVADHDQSGVYRWGVARKRALPRIEAAA
jgi:AraC family transcriptional regulator, regulatory protein of adaptative response / methylated-DNA-[protein]-cysteine methyltransferase